MAKRPSLHALHALTAAPVTPQEAEDYHDLTNLDATSQSPVMVFRTLYGEDTPPPEARRVGAYKFRSQGLFQQEETPAARAPKIQAYLQSVLGEKP